MSAPYYDRHGVTVHAGDCLAVLRELPDCSVHAIVTDPPYGLADHKPERIAPAVAAWCSGDREHVPDGKGFMGRAWDGFVPPPAVWDECLRVLTPGGHLLAFAGSRTADLMGLSVRLAGFEIRDTIMWVYGSGMPHGQNVGKAIDRMAGVEREVIGSKLGQPGYSLAPDQGRGTYAASGRSSEVECAITAPATPEAARWEGWNTALRPAQEPIIVARKPLAGTVAATVLAHGTGAIHVDACRVAHASAADLATSQAKNPGRADVVTSEVYGANRGQQSVNTAGRWPSNVVLVHADTCEDGGACGDGCPAAELDRQGEGTRAARPAGSHVRRSVTSIGNGEILNGGGAVETGGHDGSGASRFFPTFRWEAKAPSAERPQVGGVSHPTVKPLDLMRWLVRLVTPPGGTVLDPFAGSGTTLHAARAEGFLAIGIERDESYLPLIQARLDARPRQAATAAAQAGSDEPMDLLDLLDGEAS